MPVRAKSAPTAPRTLLRACAELLERLIAAGTAGYPRETQRRLRVLNVVAYLIALFTLSYAIQQLLLSDRMLFAPVIAINFALIGVALMVPFMHRLHETAGAVVAGAVRVRRAVRAHSLSGPRGRRTYSVFHWRSRALRDPGPGAAAAGDGYRPAGDDSASGGLVLLGGPRAADRRRSGDAKRALHQRDGDHGGVDRGGRLLRLQLGRQGTAANRRSAAQHSARKRRRATQRRPRARH